MDKIILQKHVGDTEITIELPVIQESFLLLHEILPAFPKRVSTFRKKIISLEEFRNTRAILEMLESRPTDSVGTSPSQRAGSVKGSPHEGRIQRQVVIQVAASAEKAPKEAKKCALKEKRGMI